jgi:hypothetical protein
MHESLISSKLSETVQCLDRGMPTSFHIQVSVMGPANLKEGFLLRPAFMHTVVRSGQIRLGLCSIDVSVSELFNFFPLQVPQIRTTLFQLKEREMLPAIWFIFSRKGCDTAVHYLHQVI